MYNSLEDYHKFIFDHSGKKPSVAFYRIVYCISAAGLISFSKWLFQDMVDTFGEALPIIILNLIILFIYSCELVGLYENRVKTYNRYLWLGGYFPNIPADEDFVTLDRFLANYMLRDKDFIKRGNPERYSKLRKACFSEGIFHLERVYDYAEAVRKISSGAFFPQEYYEKCKKNRYVEPTPENTAPPAPDEPSPISFTPKGVGGPVDEKPRPASIFDDPEGWYEDEESDEFGLYPSDYNSKEEYEEARADYYDINRNGLDDVIDRLFGDDEDDFWI